MTSPAKRIAIFLPLAILLTSWALSVDRFFISRNFFSGTGQGRGGVVGEAYGAPLIRLNSVIYAQTASPQPLPTIHREGVVLDAATGKPIMAANVTVKGDIPGKNRFTTIVYTDSTGRFRVDAPYVLNGETSLWASKLGYSVKEQRLGDQRRDPSGDVYERHIVFRLLASGAFPLGEKEPPQVEIPVYVTNQRGETVASLTKADFELSEDGVPQTISRFATEEASASVGLVFDRSGSMQGKIGRAAEAARSFLHIAQPGDEFFLVEFSDRLTLVSPFTTNVDDVMAHILPAGALGGTALLDAIRLSLEQMKKAANPRRALVLLSDGGDNQSRHSRREIEKELVEADVKVYAVGLYNGDKSRKISNEERDGVKLLQELCENTGGNTLPVSIADELPAIGDAIGARISEDLRTQYVLGYSPADFLRDGKYHRIAVKVNRVGLHVYSQRGY